MYQNDIPRMFNFFEHTSPFFRPIYERPQGYDKITHEKPESLAQAEFEQKARESAQKAKMSRDAELKRREETQRRLLAERYRNEATTLTLDSPELPPVLDKFVYRILMHKFTQYLESPKEDSAHAFAAIISYGGRLTAYLRQQNINDAYEAQRCNEEKLRPENHFYYSQFFARNVERFIYKVIKGKLAMADGYNAQPLRYDTISVQNIEETKEKKLF